MTEFQKMYQSITACPFRCNENYMEVQPSLALRPYIRCFWGTRKPRRQRKVDKISKELVIPDTCMDIIFNINYTENKINGHFCGINDTAFETEQKNDKEEIVSTFGIRFYAWSASLFAKESMKEVKNKAFDAGYHFERIKKEIEPLLFDVTRLDERIAIAEKVLMQELQEEKMNSIVADAVYEILKSKGSLDVLQLSKEIHISTRQLERLCNTYMGISPKKLSSLIRYQYLWNEIAFHPNFQVLDAVERFGYVDQSHLLYEFKKYHQMLPSEAKEYAKLKMPNRLEVDL